VQHPGAQRWNAGLFPQFFQGFEQTQSFLVCNGQQISKKTASAESERKYWIYSIYFCFKLSCCNKKAKIGGRTLKQERQEYNGCY